MKKKGKKPEDLSPPFDLEYRAKEDDAWYSVSVVLDSDAQTLAVRYLCFPTVYDAVFSAGGFKTEAEADELARRFRPVSHQVQDHQCRKLAVGTTVCAAHGTAEDDLRFYDAVIEAVNHKAHSFAGGEEECLCTFVLFWLHGRGRGTLTSANIANICTLDRFSQVDPRISGFLTFAKEKITSSKSTSVLHSSVSIEKNLESSRNGLVETERISNYEQWTSQDEDIGPRRCNIGDGLATGKSQHFILINNLEKDVTPSSISKFIYNKTNIQTQAFVFPRRFSDPFARGAIVVGCPKKVQIVYEFLANPNHLIVSSRGRPWVVTEKAVTGILGSTILLPMDLDETRYKKADDEVEIVHLGTESYDRAKELRDLFIEFMNHETQVCNRLVSEEKKILRSFNQLR
ncbi:hypothetical protein PHJA_002461800 [Phtheirospermum japonicum]|uniref:SAWADEE domain-containing protein n=1 Tax=Phtheirospermum japonicum TaxID=374723 RepID=A0A830CW12_9LAMI|nr:hypothetical protein PHJA_002461800 [Phtheirospermum japonicum]